MEKVIEDPVYDSTLGILFSDTKGTLEQLLFDITKWEKNHPPETKYSGFEWHDVHGDPRTLNSLVIKKVLSVVLKTNKCTIYRSMNRQAIEKALKDYQGLVQEPKEIEEIPPNIFNCVVGHEPKVALLMRGLQSKKPLHFLLWGSVASAKTLILEELCRLPKSHFILGSSLTKVGMYEVLFNERPKYLIIDELDKIDNPRNLTSLLSLMERGLITETKYRRHRQLRLKTWVFASANRVGRIPVELLSRFISLRFRDYSKEEFLEVSVKILNREGLSDSLALYIGNTVYQELKTHDVRDCLKVARLLKEKTKADVNYIVDILKRQK
ncbi:hypothetical protein ES705_42582 [subsurface metagenome]